MRIISQDGNYDYPYENSILCCVENSILIQNPIDRKLKIIGTYENEEKAKYAFKWITRAYMQDVRVIKMPSDEDISNMMKVFN